MNKWDAPTVHGWDGCETILNDMTGHICLVVRGACGFTVKNLNCQAAGAIATLMANAPGRGDAPGMGGDCNTGLPGGCEIPMLSLGEFDGALVQANLPADVQANDAEQLACDDDGFSDQGNGYLSQITGCVPPGDYIVSVRGWYFSSGPYVLTIAGLPGCTPTEPPSMSDTGTNASSFCPFNFPFERFCQ